MSAKTLQKTKIFVILDKSGSMGIATDATISAFYEYILTLRDDAPKSAKPVDYRVSVTLFDTEVVQLHRDLSISYVPTLTTKEYEPSGMTALYDAVGRTLADQKGDVSKDDKAMVVIITDGEENSSQEYTQEQFKAAKAELEKLGNWTFVFLGANQDVWANARRFGFAAQNVSAFNVSAAGMSSVSHNLANATRAYTSMDAGSTNQFFSKSEQTDMEKTK